MNRFLMICAALLAGTTAAVANTFTNTLENATTQLVDEAWSTDTMTVGGTTSNNLLYIAAGVVFTSTNGVAEFFRIFFGAFDDLRDIGGVRMFFVADPDGTPIELIELPPGVTSTLEMWRGPTPA